MKKLLAVVVGLLVPIGVLAHGGVEEAARQEESAVGIVQGEWEGVLWAVAIIVLSVVVARIIRKRSDKA